MCGQLWNTADEYLPTRERWQTASPLICRAGWYSIHLPGYPGGIECWVGLSAQVWHNLPKNINPATPGRPFDHRPGSSQRATDRLYTILLWLLKFQATYKELHCVPKKRTRILWPITFTNIDQYQCRLTELFLQHYLIMYHKIYSHSRVPAATVAVSTNALVQVNVDAIIQRVCPSCTYHRRVFTPGHTWFDFSRPLAT